MLQQHQRHQAHDLRLGRKEPQQQPRSRIASIGSAALSSCSAAPAE